MPVQTKIQFRRSIASDWVAVNPILSAGEVGYETDSRKFKIGDGTTAWNSLGYGAIFPSEFNELVDDRVNDLLVAGSNIGKSYNDSTNALTISVTGVSLLGHTHTSSEITDFNSSVSGLLPVKSLVAGTNISVTPTGDKGFIISSNGLDTDAVKDVIGSTISGVSGVAVSYNNTSKVVTVSLSDPSIQSTDVTDFNSAVSGLLGVKSLVQGTGIGIANNLGVQTISVTGIPSSLITDLGNIATTQVIGRTGVALSYDNVNDIMYIDTTGVSLIGHTHVWNNITDASTIATLSELTYLSGVSAGTASPSRALVLDANKSITSINSIVISGNLTVGGTGLVASNINDFNTAVRTNRLDQMAVPTGDVSFNSVKITSLADPVSAQDAATKAYVDAARMGLDVKQSVRVTTAANITLSGTQTIDGVSVIVGDRVLVKNQSTGSQNGIYDVAAGAWTRSADADSSAKVTTGMFTFVSEGTANADSGWVVTTNDEIVLGTTSLAFAQFSGAGQITAGAGLTKNGNTIDAVGTSGRIVVNADNIDLDTVTVAIITDSIPPGSTLAKSLVSSLTADSYGRVTSINNGYVLEASTVEKGLASFDSGDFSVASGVVSIKNSGVDNSQLVNSSVTIGLTPVSLGGTITSVSGLSSVSSTSFVGDLTGTATNANNVEVDLSTSNINNLVFVNGTDGNLKPRVNNNLRFNASDNELLGSSNTTPVTALKYFIIDGGTP